MRDTFYFAVPALTAVMLASCVEQAYQDGVGLAPKEPSSSSTGEPPGIPTTSSAGDPGVHTATGPEVAESSTSAGPTSASDSTGVGGNAAPKIEGFSASPKHLDEAGPIKLELVASDDVEVVKVHLELDGEKLAELTLADFPYTHDVLSAKDNGDKRAFKVTVEDGEGLTAEGTDEVGIQLPQSGVEKCIFEDPEAGTVTSMIAAVTFTSTAIVAVGARDTGGGLRLTVWMLEPKGCKLMPGWPKSMANWGGDKELMKLVSIGSAVDVDEDGNIVVAGNLLVDGKPQSYVALLTKDGSRLWEKAGLVGDEVAGVAAARAESKNRVFVVGSRRTSDAPVRTDGAVWVYQATGDKVWVPPPVTLKAPFTPDEFDKDVSNVLNEWVRAVVVKPGTGTALAVGEREFKPDINKLPTRAFALLIHPLGVAVGTPWTSKAETGFMHNAARSATVCGDSFLAGGWTRDEPADAKPQPIMFWLGPDGSATQHRADLQLAATQTHGIACDRVGKIVSAGIRSTSSPDAQVFAVTGLFDAPIWYDSGDASDDGAGSMACDAWGYCGWGGYRTADKKPYAVLRVHHP